MINIRKGQLVLADPYLYYITFVKIMDWIYVLNAITDFILIIIAVLQLVLIYKLGKKVNQLENKLKDRKDK